MKIAQTIACAVVLFAATATVAEPAVVGDYRLSGGPDVVGALILQADGRFKYGLSAGALDEHAEGRWQATDGKIRLFTEPKPKPPVFSVSSKAATTDGPLKLLVTWPNGNGIAGVDFTIGFDAGEPVSGYTQDYGWTMSGDERRPPRWVEFTEPIHGFVSPRFAIDVGAANALTFVLTPNDLGTVDFDGTLIERSDDRLIMHQRLGDLTFVRAAAEPENDGRR